jgi:hypothetical protein
MHSLLKEGTDRRDIGKERGRGEQEMASLKDSLKMSSFHF